MNIIALFEDVEFQKHMMTVALGLVRLVIFLSATPFFGTRGMHSLTMPIAVALYIPVHPYLCTLYVDLDLSTALGMLNFMVLICKEALIGYLLGFITMTIIYAALAAGSIIDNQRGASMAQASDPLSQVESTPLGVALHLAIIVFFFASGAFMVFLDMFYSTYKVWSPFELLPSLLNANVSLFTLQLVDKLMMNTLVLCGPFIIVTLMCDVALGLVNRFAPQLNVFILSMPIKSGICALLILIYISPFFNFSNTLFTLQLSLVEQLKLILGSSIPL